MKKEVEKNYKLLTLGSPLHRFLGRQDDLLDGDLGQIFRLLGHHGRSDLGDLLRGGLPQHLWLWLDQLNPKVGQDLVDLLAEISVLLAAEVAVHLVDGGLDVGVLEADEVEDGFELVGVVQQAAHLLRGRGEDEAVDADGRGLLEDEELVDDVLDDLLGGLGGVAAELAVGEEVLEVEVVVGAEQVPEEVTLGLFHSEIEKKNLN